MDPFDGAIWFKSRRSQAGGNDCVEIAITRNAVGVRDTKDHGTGPILAFSPDEWATFTASVKAGDFDRRS